MSASNTGISKRGIDLLHDPRINKSTAFTEAERQALGMVGLVPDVTESVETQLSRVLQLKVQPNDLERFIHLMNLLETNETLFYRTLMSDPARFLKIVCDPTIGEAPLKFDHILHHPHGHVSVDHSQGARQGRAAQLAGQRRAFHLRDQWRPYPWSWRPGRQRHGHSDRQASKQQPICG